MTELALVKLPGGGLAPLSAPDQETIQRWKAGAVIRAEFREVRNPRFHKKFFSLLNLAFDYWEPAEIEHSRHGRFTPQKDFDEFRKWLLVQAGFFDVIGYPDGSVRLRAKSISWAKMDDEEFSRLYQAVFNVIWEKMLSQTFSSPLEMENVVNQLMGYA